MDLKKLRNKDLVLYWMEQRKVNDIIIQANHILVHVRASMSPDEAEKLTAGCGHLDDVRAGMVDGKRYIILPRF